MATTTNYGWTTPDDTALVKDGASAIRTLGTSIDTTTKNLNPSTTLGDIEYRSSTANTNTRLGIGTTGQVLSVSGGVPAWATPATAGGMTLLSTTTLSGASTTISSISQSYKQLYVYFVNAYYATAGYNVWIRFNSDTSALYSTSWLRGVNSSVETSNSVADTKAIVGRTTDVSTAEHRLSGNFLLPNYTSTGTKIGNGDFNLAFSGNIYGGFSTFKYTGSSAISSITFLSDGSISATDGTVYIYGVN